MSHEKKKQVRLVVEDKTGMDEAAVLSYVEEKLDAGFALVSVVATGSGWYRYFFKAA